MKWKAWKMGAIVSLALSLFVAGAGLVEGTTWRQFIAIFCTAALTHFVTFLKDHPIDPSLFQSVNTQTATTETQPK